MKKKIYEKPTMQVVKLQHQCQILVGSNFGANNVSNSDGIGWQTGGFDDGDDDY